MKRLTAVLLFSVLGAACAGGDDDPGDPGGDPADPSSEGGCAVASDLGNMGAMTGETSGSGPDGYVGIDVEINADPDIVSVQLFSSFGAFLAMGGINTGTYDLTGPESTWEDCGACVVVWDEDYEMYMAKSG